MSDKRRTRIVFIVAKWYFGVLRHKVTNDGVSRTATIVFLWRNNCLFRTFLHVYDGKKMADWVAFSDFFLFLRHKKANA